MGINESQTEIPDDPEKSREILLDVLGVGLAQQV